MSLSTIVSIDAGPSRQKTTLRRKEVHHVRSRVGMGLLFKYWWPESIGVAFAFHRTILSSKYAKLVHTPNSFVATLEMVQATAAF